MSLSSPETVGEKRAREEDVANAGDSDHEAKQRRKRHRRNRDHDKEYKRESGERHRRRRHHRHKSSRGRERDLASSASGGGGMLGSTAEEDIVRSMMRRSGINRILLNEAVQKAATSELDDTLYKMRECKNRIEKEMQRRRLGDLEKMIQKLCWSMVAFYEDKWGEDSFSSINMDEWIESYKVTDMVRYAGTQRDIFECWIQCNFSWGPYIRDGVVTTRLYEEVVYDLTREDSDGKMVSVASVDESDDDEHVYGENESVHTKVDMELFDQAIPTGANTEDEIYTDEKEQLYLVEEGKTKNSSIKNRWDNQRIRWLIQAFSCAPLFAINDMSFNLTAAYPQIRQYVKWYDEFVTTCIEEL